MELSCFVELNGKQRAAEIANYKSINTPVSF